MRQVPGKCWLGRVMCNTPPSAPGPDGSSCLPQSNPVISCCEGKTANTPSFRSHRRLDLCLLTYQLIHPPFFCSPPTNTYQSISINTSLAQHYTNPYLSTKLSFNLAQIAKLKTYKHPSATPSLSQSAQKMIQAKSS